MTEALLAHRDEVLRRPAKLIDDHSYEKYVAGLQHGLLTTIASPGCSLPEPQLGSLQSPYTADQHIPFALGQQVKQPELQCPTWQQASASQGAQTAPKAHPQTNAAAELNHFEQRANIHGQAAAPSRPDRRVCFLRL